MLFIIFQNSVNNIISATLYLDSELFKFFIKQLTSSSSYNET